jgi:transposase-like protein
MTTVLPARHRRTHTLEFKTELVAICRQPGISVSAVALAHGVNSNLVRRWMMQFPVVASLPVASAPTKFVPVQVEAINTSSSDGDIQFDIQRGATRINIRWPMAGAESCAQWLSAWLK